MTIAVDPVERFWSRVDKHGPVHPDLGTACWLWTGKPHHTGYGVLTLPDPAKRIRQVRVHRYSYEMAHGPIPDGLLVCHRCDTPLCVNPAHLFLGTHGDNQRDCAAKGRLTERMRAAARVRGEMIRLDPVVRRAHQQMRSAAARAWWANPDNRERMRSKHVQA